MECSTFVKGKRKEGKKKEGKKEGRTGRGREKQNGVETGVGGGGGQRGGDSK